MRVSFVLELSCEPANCVLLSLCCKRRLLTLAFVLFSSPNFILLFLVTNTIYPRSPQEERDQLESTSLDSIIQLSNDLFEFIPSALINRATHKNQNKESNLTQEIVPIKSRIFEQQEKQL